MKKIATNKILVALGAGVVATAGIAASANTLSGLTDAGTGNLGTNSAIVAGCDGTIAVNNWVIASYAGGVVNTTGVTLAITDSGTEPCIGQKAAVTFTKSDDTQLGSTVTVASLLASNNLTFAGINSKDVAKIYVTISQ